jgi:hypothetical protein
MKSNILFPLFLLSVMAVSGCKTYEYRITEPANLAQRIGKQPVTVSYSPLQYHMARRGDLLAMTIDNPTDDRIVLRGDQSFVVGPKGESHQVPGKVIAPHSFMFMTVPPVETSYQTGTPYGWWGPGFYPGWGYPYSSLYGGYYGSYYFGPYQTTTYDWVWKTGPARLRLSYDRDGKSFDHSFVITREVAQ